MAEFFECEELKALMSLTLNCHGGHLPGNSGSIVKGIRSRKCTKWESQHESKQACILKVNSVFCTC